jgi:hypothetical protein
MADKSISMHINDTLELDYLVEQISDDTIDITNEPDDSSSPVDYIKKQIGVFNPSVAGTYNLDINGQTIEIDVFEIPESEADQKLTHRWYLSEDSDPFIDQIGSADGTNIGTTQDIGDWVDNKSRKGNGTDAYINIGNPANFSSDIKGNFSMAVSFQVSTASQVAIGGAVGDNPWTRIIFNSEGQIKWGLKDNSGNDIRIRSNISYDDGNPHRVVFNKTGDTESDLSIWVDGSEISTTPTSIGTLGSWANKFGAGSGTETDWYWFAESADNTPRKEFPGILDDPCTFNDSLVSSEILNYDAPWYE